MVNIMSSYIFSRTRFLRVLGYNEQISGVPSRPLQASSTVNGNLRYEKTPTSFFNFFPLFSWLFLFYSIAFTILVCILFIYI